MRVSAVTRLIAGVGQVVEPGQDADVPDEAAERFIRLGAATPAKPARARKPAAAAGGGKAAPAKRRTRKPT